MEIRALTSPDLDTVHTINESAVPMVGRVTKDELAHIVEQSSIALVAHPCSSPTQVVGFCLVLAPGADYGSENFAWFRQRYDDFIYLDRVAILDSCRGQGLGRRLYDTVVTTAAQRCQGAKRLTLEVNIEPRNDVSLAFHEQLGFEVVGERATRYGTKVALMQKALRS